MAKEVKKREVEYFFWNNPKVISAFYNEPLSKYWVDYFGSIKNKHNKNILDLGCGGGRNTEFLARAGFKVYAGDKFEGMVMATRRRIDGLINQSELEFIPQILQMEMDKLPFADSFFDLVLVHGVFHNACTVREFKNAVRECSRVLKKRGTLCVNCFTNEYIGDDIKQKGPNFYVTNDKFRMVLFGPSNLVKLLEDSGLMNIPKYSKNYISDISTGRRAVFRGVLRKI